MQRWATRKQDVTARSCLQGRLPQSRLHTDRTIHVAEDIYITPARLHLCVSRDAHQNTSTLMSAQTRANKASQCRAPRCSNIAGSESSGKWIDATFGGPFCECSNKQVNRGLLWATQITITFRMMKHTAMDSPLPSIKQINHFVWQSRASCGGVPQSRAGRGGAKRARNTAWQNGDWQGGAE
jgi:hypothetical protein